MRNVDVGYGDDWDDRFDDGPEYEPETCATCGRRDYDMMPCPCGCQKHFHQRCTTTCFKCGWPLCEQAQVPVSEETYCPECAVDAMADAARFDPNTPDPGAAERGERARAGFHRSAA